MQLLHYEQCNIMSFHCVYIYVKQYCMFSLHSFPRDICMTSAKALPGCPSKQNTQLTTVSILLGNINITDHIHNITIKFIN